MTSDPITKFNITKREISHYVCLELMQQNVHNATYEVLWQNGKCKKENKITLAQYLLGRKAYISKTYGDYKTKQS